METLEVICPYCHQVTCVEVDSRHKSQHFIEDCQVCCRPILFTIECEDGEVASYSADRDSA